MYFAGNHHERVDDLDAPRSSFAGRVGILRGLTKNERFLLDILLGKLLSCIDHRPQTFCIGKGAQGFMSLKKSPKRTTQSAPAELDNKSASGLTELGRAEEQLREANLTIQTQSEIIADDNEARYKLREANDSLLRQVEEAERKIAVHVRRDQATCESYAREDAELTARKMLVEVRMKMFGLFPEVSMYDDIEQE